MNKIEEIDNLSVEKRVVVMVGASWCGPCKLKKPTFLHLKEKHQNIHMEYIDGDDFPEFKAEHDVKKYPTFIALERSGEVGRMEGAKQTASELEAFILGQ